MTTAIVLDGHENYVGSFLIENLSAGGALLVDAPGLQRGTRVTLLLQLGRGRPIGISADIVRVEARESDEGAFAVSFQQLRPTLEDRNQCTDGLLTALPLRCIGCGGSNPPGRAR